MQSCPYIHWSLQFTNAQKVDKWATVTKKGQKMLVVIIEWWLICFFSLIFLLSVQVENWKYPASAQLPSSHYGTPQVKILYNICLFEFIYPTCIVVFHLNALAWFSLCKIVQCTLTKVFWFTAGHSTLGFYYNSQFISLFFSF